MSTLTLDKQSLERMDADMNKKAEMLTDEQVNAIAQMVNNAVNLPLLGEKAEFVVFAKIVRMLDKKLYEVLPNEYYELINDASNGISEEEAAKMEERLTNLLNEKVNIPFISERKEAILIGIVIGQVVRAMVNGFKLGEKPIA
jgi:ribosomal protein S13